MSYIGIMLNSQLICYQLLFIILMIKMTPTGIEPVLPPWKGDVLTAWPRSLILFLFLIWKNSPSRARTYNNSVNSRVLYHWAIEDYNKPSLPSIPSKPNTKHSVSYLPYFFLSLWLSFRSISTCQLNTSLCLHLRPIYLVVFKGPSSCDSDISSWGGLHA